MEDNVIKYCSGCMRLILPLFHSKVEMRHNGVTLRFHKRCSDSFLMGYAAGNQNEVFGV